MVGVVEKLCAGYCLIWMEGILERDSLGRVRKSDEADAHTGRTIMCHDNRFARRTCFTVDLLVAVYQTQLPPDGSRVTTELHEQLLDGSDGLDFSKLQAAYGKCAAERKWGIKGTAVPKLWSVHESNSHSQNRYSYE